MIDADIAEEELGMCLDCSDEYWSHTGKFVDTLDSYPSDVVDSTRNQREEI
jgi:hypothetical protein